MGVTRRTTELRYTAPGSEQTERRIDQLGEAGERAGRRIQRGAGQASTGLVALNTVSIQAQGGLAGLAASAGPAGRVLSGLGPAGIAAGAGIGVVTIGLTALTRAGGAVEQQMLTVEGVLRATGGTSGKTAEEINALAREIGLSTLASTGQVREAGAQLLTFRSVAGDVFDRTLRDAQDLAALGFGSISSATVQLAKALEDPRQGLIALRRVGVSFTQGQQDLINSLHETGQVAAAQTIILDVLEQQVGGAGVAQAGGLAGAVDSLSENWTTLLEDLGNRGPVEAATAVFSGLSEGVAFLDDNIESVIEGLKIVSVLLPGVGQAVALNDALTGDETAGPESQLAARRGELAELTRRRDAAATGPAIRPGSLEAGGLQQLEQTIDLLRQEIAAIEELLALRDRESAAGAIAAERRREQAAADSAAAADRDRAIAAETAAAEAAAKAAERLAIQRDRAIGGLQFQVQRLGALAAAHGDGAAAIAAATAETEALTLARRVGLEAGDAELEQIRELIGERDRHTATIEAAAEAEEARQKAMEEAARAARDNFEAIVDFGRDQFTGWFDDLASDWQGLWGDLGRTALRALAGIAAQAAATLIAPTFAPQIAGFAGIGGGGLGGFGSPGGIGNILTGSGSFLGGTLGGFGGLNQFGFETLGTGLPGLGGGLTGATLTSVLGAAGIGAFGGGLLAGLTGGNQLGGSVGGGLGAGIGFAVGGPLGALVGGVLGGLGGGLFGGGSSTEFNAFSADLASGAITQGTTEIRSGAGQQNADAARQLAQSFAQQIAPAVLQAIGGSLPAGANVAFGVSSLGVQVQGLGGAPTGFGLTPDQALAEAVQRLIGLAEGVSDELRAAVAASTATTAEGLVSDIDFARFILGGDQVTLSDALAAAAAEFDTMRERAAGLGLDMDKTAEAIGRAEQAVTDQLLGGIEAFQQSLSIGAFAPGSPLDRFGIAQGLFGELTGSALSGDLAAIAAFPAAAQQFLGLAQSVFASGPEFAAVFADVNGTLNTILDIPSFAHGTGSAPSGLALVGERGPEIVNFRGGEQVIDAGRTRAAFAGGGLGGADGATAALGQLVDLAQARLEVDERSDARLARIEGEQIKLNRRLDRLAGGAG